MGGGFHVGYTPLHDKVGIVHISAGQISSRGLSLSNRRARRVSPESSTATAGRVRAAWGYGGGARMKSGG